MASFNNGESLSDVRSKLNATGLRKNNFNVSQSSPGTGSDTSKGYEIGSLWLDSDNGILYVATDVTTGSATWSDISSGASYTDSDVDTHLNTGTATSNQVLSWTGSDYDWVAQTASYTNSSVDAHLNQSNPTSGYVLSWNGSDYAWVVNGSGFNQSLNTTDDVEFNSITSVGVGAPTIDSASTITLDAPDGVLVTSGTMRLASLTTTERNNLTAVNGDMIYNTTLNKIQGYQNGSWINMDGT